jgi:hypothetical protein
LIQLGTRQAAVGGLVRRFSPRAANAVDSYRAAVVKIRFLPLSAFGAAILGRLAQLGQLAALTFAMGSVIGVQSALLALGV